MSECVLSKLTPAETLRHTQGVDHFGQKIAPIMVTLSFLQMCGTLVDFDMQWPPELRRLLSSINFININVEVPPKSAMPWPECSVTLTMSVCVRARARVCMFVCVHACVCSRLWPPSAPWHGASQPVHIHV